MPLSFYPSLYFVPVSAVPLQNQQSPTLLWHTEYCGGSVPGRAGGGWEELGAITTLKGQFHEIWGFFNGYTWEEHRFKIHR
jgi:hypothetical protein